VVVDRGGGSDAVLGGGYTIVVPLSDDLRGHRLWFDTPVACTPIEGKVSIELVHGHAVGRIDAPLAHDVGAGGDFDAIVCPKRVAL
jgi:hypothetical protein